MTKPHSSLYSVHHPGLIKKLSDRIVQGCSRSSTLPLLFFRADDIGIPSYNFTKLIACFKKHKIPLCLAIVPSWANKDRLAELHQITGKGSSQWCWHQHGRLHRNFEQSGKKQEFGPSRTKEEIADSLKKGRNRLEELLGQDFYPVFTPPWNRCSGDTLQALTELHYKAVSRSKGAAPEPPLSLIDYQVNVDLHTRKEVSPHLTLNNLLQEIEQGISSGLCGIMIHHQRMNKAAFDLLDILLQIVGGSLQLETAHFKDLPSSHL